MLTKQQLYHFNANHTYAEILQQPSVWQQCLSDLEDNQASLLAFIQPILAIDHLKIILTGAGTSAYIGKTLESHLNAATAHQVTAIATTDMVINPELYLTKQQPTLLVSFARSGDSPESVATVNLANQCVDHIYHLIITCNADGQLHKQACQSSNSFSLLLPNACNDKSFAMTSSFTTMKLAALAIFSTFSDHREQMIALSKKLLDKQQFRQIELLAQLNFNKVVFIGNGPLAATAQEAALKMLELTAGQVQCYFETTLGFRHGPKSVVDDKTLIILLNSQQPYQQQYQQDLYQELVSDGQTSFVYQIDKLLPNGHCMLTDVWLSFPYIVYCQLLAFYKALALEISPDNPCPSGEVNRVVQGVKIYPYQPNLSKE